MEGAGAGSARLRDEVAQCLGALAERGAVQHAHRVLGGGVVGLVEAEELVIGLGDAKMSTVVLRAATVWGPDDRWLLVTSAYHMPRAVGAFRQAGLNISPFPVDFRTRDADDILRFPISVAAGLQRADLAVREWIGLVVYRVAGRSSAVFPAP